MKFARAPEPRSKKKKSFSALPTSTSSDPDAWLRRIHGSPLPRTVTRISPGARGSAPGTKTSGYGVEGVPDDGRRRERLRATEMRERGQRAAENNTVSCPSLAGVRGSSMLDRGLPTTSSSGRCSSAWPCLSGSGSRGARIHTSCAVVSAPTLDRAFARWCFTVECDRPRRWAAAFSDPATRTAATTPTSRSVARRRGGTAVASCAASQSKGSGGSARRIVIGRSLVAGLSLSPRPEPRGGSGRPATRPRGTSPGRCVGIGGPSPSGGARTPTLRASTASS